MLKKYYTGSCINLDERLQDHFNKKFADSFTAKVNDWELFYSIPDLEYNQARKIEQHIKRMKSKIYIQNLKRFGKISIQLRNLYP